ncbi:MAG TPA: tetratricopeptide repeat-containing diguanylate cyclase [Thermoanaerobaculia bacterium]|nr:tetratricopeptide repeat-containing diguanylate cyclase [Thermoanaerobaculia bacterium]
MKWLPLLVCLAVTAVAQTPRVILERGIAAEDAGRLNEAARDYETVRAAAERAGDRQLLSEALTHIAYMQYYRGEMNEALVSLQRAYEIGDAKSRRAALEAIAHVYADSKVAQYDRAIEYYRQLLGEFEAVGEGKDVADTLFNLGSTADRKGDLDGALEWYRRALAAEERLGRRDEAAFVKRSIAITLGKLDRPAEALPLLDDALRVFAEKKDTERAMVVRQSRGIIYRRLGRLDEAIADLEATRPWFVQQKNVRFLEKSEEELAAAYAAAGKWREAYAARTRHNALQRELAEKLREEQTARMRVRFDAEKKEQENRSLLRVRRLQWIVLVLGAAIIVVLALLFRRMRAMALTDELTRLPNRRHLLAVAEEQHAGGEPFSVVAIDVDHFKRINDTYGHAAGDVVLQRVAQACRGALRPGDRIGRTGGEELSVILPDTREGAAIAVAERLRAAVESLDLRDVDAALRVTISLGVAEWNGQEPLARVTARADERLYRAKEEGRNRVAAA